MSAVDQGIGEDERPLVVVPDANVLIHGKALVDLPWVELGRSQVEVVFVPPVIRELDKLKTQTGRQNRIARQLSSEIRTLITGSDRRAQIRRADPTVAKRVELRPVMEVLHPALRLEHADQALINYALWLRGEGNDVLLLTDDTICGTTASEVGLSVHFLPEQWLRQPEPDESAKENARLKAEVQRLSAAEPKVELGFRSAEGELLTELQERLTHWPALSEAEIDELIADVQRLCPQATSFERAQPRATDALLDRFERVSQLSVFGRLSVYEPANEEEINRYKTEDYPNWLASVRLLLASMHDRLGAQKEWPLVVAIATNAGTRPAVGALLTIRSQGAIALLNDADLDEDEDNEEQGCAKIAAFELPLPPPPPRGRTKTVDAAGMYRGTGDLFGVSRGLNASAFATASAVPRYLRDFSSPKVRESDAFYWRVGRRDWVETMELECASWRHGQDLLKFALKVRPNEQVATSAAIEICVNVHNIADACMARLPVRFHYENGPTLDKGRALVDLLGRSARARDRARV